MSNSTALLTIFLLSAISIVSSSVFQATIIGDQTCRRNSDTMGVPLNTLTWGDDGNRFSVIKFRIFTNEGGVVPSGSTIDSATLTFTGENDGEYRGNIYRSAVNWAENTVTYNNFGASPGADTDDFDGPSVAELPDTRRDRQLTVDVTSAVRAWNSGQNNYGFVIVPNGNRRGHSSVYSSESQDSPVLEITVRPTYQGYDGNGNNLQNPSYGAVDAPLLRQVMGANGNIVIPPSYQDGLSSPRELDANGDPLPSARQVSNLVANHIEQRSRARNPRRHTDLLTYFGQFLDHDIDLTPEGGDEFNIQVPANDPVFSGELHFTRAVPISGTPATDPLEHPNIISAFIDGTNVYGSDLDRATKLRTMNNGLMKTSPGDFLPYNLDELNLEMANIGFVPDNETFVAGDVRANENAVLMSLHTLFIREHNRIAGELQTENPTWSDERLYQEARMRVIGILQSITMYEWLPEVIGNVPNYNGYNDNVNPGIMSVFSGAAFRFGHSLISTVIHRVDPNFHSIPQGPLLLRNAFFNPVAIQYGIGSILRGVMMQQHEAVDVLISDDLRNFLFQSVGGGGANRHDLFSLNLQRGRDLGLPDYNTLRAAYGFNRLNDFSDISSDPATVNALATAYVSVDDIDPFVGGLAEDHLPNSKMGELFTAILRDQFVRLRDGDRFWFENGRFSQQETQQLRNTKMLDVIIRNTDTRQSTARDFESAFSLSDASDVPNM